MLTVRHIQTTTRSVTRDGATATETVPALDADGHEIVLWSVELPREIEATGGDAIDAYVAAQTAAQTAAPAVPAADTAPEEHAQ